jgi:hypoxanthine phosphoribosyltransferase
LISEDRIRERVSQLAARISADHADAGEVVLIGILKGAFIFLADLARQITVPHVIEFMALSSYGRHGANRSDLRVVMDLRESIAHRSVVIIEDIVDSGRTLRHLMDLLATRHPASLRVCTLVRKPSKLEVDVPIDYLGFDVPDAWLVGYGLDYAEQYRTLPYIGVVDPT